MGFEASIDRSNGQINKKVRNAQLAQWNYILVAGEEEMAAGLVDVRTRDTERHGKMRVDEVAAMLTALKPMPSTSYNSFYEKAWDPSQFAAVESKPVEEIKPTDESKITGEGKTE
jgi:hypothetical protein